ncbi:MAG: thermonuclease family protein [Proteobacteria bacterium]|nr:thermonuclease family protein [Pseudomonadota bacterium]
MRGGGRGGAGGDGGAPRRERSGGGSRALPLLQVLLLLVGCGAPSPPPPHAAWQVQVIAVTDGDTLRVRRDGQNTIIRLHGVDAPERAQPFGERASQFASSFAFGRSATIEPITVDRYSRLVARVFVDGRCLNEELVAQGLAWHYRRYSTSATLEQLEGAARAARRGLWSEADPVPPWDWRRQHPRSAGKASSKQLMAARAGVRAQALAAAPESAASAPARGGGWIGNVRSRVFHRSDCTAARCKRCTLAFASAKAALRAGYRPHTTCDPNKLNSQ